MAQQTDDQINEEQLKQLAANLNEEDDNPNYKVPVKKALDDMLKQDQDDESLEKYKKEVLKGAEPGIVLYEDNKLNAIPVKLALVVQDRADTEMDLSMSLGEIKKTVFRIKEGISYKLKIYFYIQREIVTGMRYIHRLSRKGIKVDKTSYMVGSYAPKRELQCFLTPAEEAPSGMLARGSYKVESKFTDDDGHDYLQWEWTLEIKKDWKD